MEKTKLSRRDFVGGASLGIAAIAGSAVLSACTPSTGNPSDNDTTSNIVWDEEYDIVIAGSGGAGHAAALEALQKDSSLSVVIFESMSTIGGNSGLNRGNYGAVGTDIQKKQGETDIFFKDDTPDLYFAEKCKLGDYRMDPKLTRIFVDKCLEGYHWLNDLGVSFQKVKMYDEAIPAPENIQGLKLRMNFNPDFSNGDWVGPQSKGRHHNSATYNGVTGGSAAIRAMSDAAEALGDFSVVTETKVVEVIRAENLTGDVLGVKVKDAYGTRAVKARKGVILAAGGFTANPEMLRKHDPRMPEGIGNTGVEGVDGSCIIAAQDIGADVRGMDFIQHGFEGTAANGKAFIAKRGFCIQVDSTGKRFWKETESKATYRDARVTLLHELGHNLWYSITDAPAIEALGIKPENIESGQKAGTFWVADTIEDLAKAIGLPADVLSETVATWNQYCDAGEDADFGQESRYLRKVQTPPFYGESRAYFAHSTPGGLCVDENTQVLDRRGNTIPRLYAAGEITGGLHGTERNGGCSWTECVVFGRIAGASVAALDSLA